MKLIWSIILAFTFGMISCQKESSNSIEAFSSDKEFKITLEGSRTNRLDSWMIEIRIDHAGIKHFIYQEFYADKICKENVTFKWKSNRSCIIHLTQRDGEVIAVPVQMNQQNDFL